MTGAARFWVATLAAGLGIAATLALGLWQLGRAQQKTALAEAIAQRRDLPPLDARALLAAADRTALHHRPVQLRGAWIADRTVFLDNRQLAGRPGFYVATPLRLADADAVVLVQRGWAPRNFVERTQLPQVETPAGEVVVRGRIAPPPAKLYEPGPAAGGPIRQNLDLAAFRSETGLALLVDVSVQETGAPSQGLQRAWPQPDTGVAKHHGYAVQWWSLSGLIAVLYVWFQFIAPRRRQAPPA